MPRFARGYVVSDTPVDLPVAGWITLQAGGLWVSRAPDVQMNVARSAGHFALVIGHFVDTEKWHPTDVALSSAVQALARSEREFLDATDPWSGRYVVIYGTDTHRHVIQDATAMRSAFYSIDGPFLLGSHARLVASLKGAETSPIRAAYRMILRGAHFSPIVRAYRAIVHPGQRVPVMSMPGRLTPWAGIVHLTANMVLDIDTRVLRRVFPHRSLPDLTPFVAAADIARRLRGQVGTLVASGHPVAISLTGGIDSRVTAAASRDVHTALRYFTYRRDDVPRDHEDVARASSIAEALHLRYDVLDVGPSVEPPELDSAIREATFLSHGRRIVSAYRVAFSDDTIHIRSNVGEVGRCFYRQSRNGRRMPTSPEDIAARDLARLWAHADVREPLVEAFAEWMDATSFRDASGIDALDLFYWEHRMSCWHSNVVLESDFAFDTHVLFNSRTILERFLSVPVEDRRRGSVFRHLVTQMWPELGSWPMGHEGIFAV